jgi:hypothetical protein
MPQIRKLILLWAVLSILAFVVMRTRPLTWLISKTFNYLHSFTANTIATNCRYSADSTGSARSRSINRPIL